MFDLPITEFMEHDIYVFLLLPRPRLKHTVKIMVFEILHNARAGLNWYLEAGIAYF